MDVDVYNCNGRGKTTSYLKFLFWVVSCPSGMKRQGEYFFSEMRFLKDPLWLSLFEPAELQKEDQKAQGWCLCFWAPSAEAKLHQDWILHIACVAYFHRIFVLCAGRSFFFRCQSAVFCWHYSFYRKGNGKSGSNSFSFIPSVPEGTWGLGDRLSDSCSFAMPPGARCFGCRVGVRVGSRGKSTEDLTLTFSEEFKTQWFEYKRHRMNVCPFLN